MQKSTRIVEILSPNPDAESGSGVRTRTGRALAEVCAFQVLLLLFVISTTIIIFFNPGRKSWDFENYKKQHQAGETTNAGDQQPKDCRATKLN